MFRQNGSRPGEPCTQITLPLSTLQGLQVGQGIPTGKPNHLLVKTETGQYQILRVGPPGQQSGAVPATSQLQLQPSPAPQVMRPAMAAGNVVSTMASSPATVMRPTAPATVSQVVRQPIMPTSIAPGPTMTRPTVPVAAPPPVQQSAAAAGSVIHLFYFAQSLAVLA